MADLSEDIARESGLSGHSVRGIADTQTQANMDSLSGQGIEETVRQVADTAREAFNEAGTVLSDAITLASDKTFESAANVGRNIASSPEMTQSAFTWGGYFQALGILCILLAVLWFAVWCIRKYGKLNFIPRPGALPKDALIMEAQMPLGPKKGLMVVRFLNKRLLLGVTEHQISLITEGNADYERPANKFQDIMENIQDTGHNSGPDNSPS